MSALPYQPVPTASQQRELERWVQRKYPVRQYRDNVDEAIAEMQAARLRYELARLHSQPSESVLRAAGEPCCAIPTPGEDGEPQVMAWVGSTPVLIIVALACVAWVAYFWSAV